MKDGAVVGQGPPREVVTEQLLEHVYGVRCLVTPDPLTHEPMVIPRPRLKPNS